jgi:hypothetical protein
MSCRAALRGVIASALLIALSTMTAPAAVPNVTSNVDTANHFAWGENIGWINFRGQGTGPANVPPPTIGMDFCSGFAWGENVGWVNLGDGSPTNGSSYSQAAGDTGVTVDSGTGALSGFAWGENIGWINFGWTASGSTADQHPKVDLATGEMSGYAWGENVGWISLDGTQNGGMGGPTSVVTVQAPTATQIANGLAQITPIPAFSDRQPDGAVDAADVVTRVNDGAP